MIRIPFYMNFLKVCHTRPWKTNSFLFCVWSWYLKFQLLKENYWTFNCSFLFTSAFSHLILSHLILQVHINQCVCSLTIKIIFQSIFTWWVFCEKQILPGSFKMHDMDTLDVLCVLNALSKVWALRDNNWHLSATL